MVMSFQHMDKSIFEKQSDILLIQCLYAQRRYYTYAKIISGSYFIICVVLFCVFAILKATLHSDVISGISIVLSIIVTFGSKLFEKLSSNMKETAAKIQQYIDISLYSDNPYEKSIQSWNCPIDQHQIIELVSSFPQSGFTVNDKWYGDYSEKQYWEQIYFCQKENIRWDKNLRQKYKTVCYSILIIASVGVLIVAFICNPTFFEIMSIVPWVLPFIKYMVSFNKSIKNDQEQITQMIDKANSIPNVARVFDVDKLLKRESTLQDKLFEYRKTALLIPNFFYKIFRKNQQQNEDRIVQNEKKVKKQ